MIRSGGCWWREVKQTSPGPNFHTFKEGCQLAPWLILPTCPPQLVMLLHSTPTYPKLAETVPRLVDSVPAYLSYRLLAVWVKQNSRDLYFHLLLWGARALKRHQCFRWQTIQQSSASFRHDERLSCHVSKQNSSSIVFTQGMVVTMDGLEVWGLPYALLSVWSREIAIDVCCMSPCAASLQSCPQRPLD